MIGRVRAGTAALCVGLLALTVAGVVAMIGVGARGHTQPTIAGGYDLVVPNQCLGGVTPFDLTQSGEFLSLTNAASSIGGALRLQAAARGRARRLTGTVSCVGGGVRRLRASVTVRPRPRLVGVLGRAPLVAALSNAPPAPGAPLPYLPTSLRGAYGIAPQSICLGDQFGLRGGGDSLYALSAAGHRLGVVSYDRLTGSVSGVIACTGGGAVRLRAQASGLDLTDVELTPLVGGGKAKSAPAAESFDAIRVGASIDRVAAAFFIAVAAVILLARLFGMTAMRLGAPRVMGEVLAGIVLGPSVLGAISRPLQAQLFPADIIAPFAVAAELGLIFYMFLIGLELNFNELRGRVSHAMAIAGSGIAFPMLLGIAIAIPLYRVLGPQTKFAGFALFIGVAMSITAFPILGRILAERRMLKRPLGQLVLTCGAVDDAAGWLLIGIATTIAATNSFGGVARVGGETIAFCVVIVYAVRPLLRRVSDAFDQSGRTPPGWVALIFSGILISAYAGELIGIGAILGGFLMGTVMPRDADLTEDITHRVEDFTVTLLLPLFFAYIGLQMNVGLLDRPLLWLIALVLVGVAIVGKLAGAAIAARLGGRDWRSSLLIGTLMNTRGLTELIVLNVALEEKVISSLVFTMLVLMALITTFMAAPLIRFLDPSNALGAPVEEELVESRERSLAAFPALTLPRRSILVAAQTDQALSTLRELAEPLARSQPPRELILARLVRPPRAAGVRGGLQSENALVRRAQAEVERSRDELAGRGVAARAVAFASAHPGEDLARLAASEEIDLLLVDGQRPLLGDPVPLVDIKPALERAPCDVGVLVAREGARIGIGPGAPLLVPFGGVEHDWSALELGAWLAAATGATLQLLGVVAAGDEAAAVRRRLDDAGLLVREFARVSTEAVVVENGRAGILAAARSARLLVVGLSERWREEGMGDTRSHLARTSTAPILFVRRGKRAGALAPRDDFTRFSWSSVGMGDAQRPEL